MNNYQLITDATSDLPTDSARALGIEVIPMNVDLGEISYSYTPGGGEITPDEFYAQMREGKSAGTSQITPMVYLEYFERYLAQGVDVLYICFSSGLSSTIQAARLCQDQLREKYPERRLEIVDSLCASVGEAFFVLAAAHKQQEGLGLEELRHWLEENKLSVCHWFTVDDLSYLRRGGRLSSVAAALGTTLQIKPVLHVDNDGRLINVAKAHGRKKSLSAMAERLERTIRAERGKTVFIGHGACPEDASYLAELIKRSLPDMEISIIPIGPVIGAHTGPGVVALFFWGTER